MKKKSREIGIEISKPKEICTDKKCPFHGALKVRGRTLKGTVVSKDTHKSATVEFIRKKFIPKFERHEARRTRLRVHNPSCINAEIGDIVMIIECRPLSKTKKFVVIEKQGEDIAFKQKQETIQDAKAEEPKLEKKEQGE